MQLKVSFVPSPMAPVCARSPTLPPTHLPWVSNVSSKLNHMPAEPAAPQHSLPSSQLRKDAANHSTTQSQGKSPPSKSPLFPQKPQKGHLDQLPKYFWSVHRAQLWNRNPRAPLKSHIHLFAGTTSPQRVQDNPDSPKGTPWNCTGWNIPAATPGH